MEEITDFIACDKPVAADKWVNSLFEKVDLLKDNPKIGRIVPEIGVPSIREFIFGNYRIVYRYSKNLIMVLTVRNFRQILPIEDVGSDPE
jgi:toxin ParE1/3/4